MLPLALAQSVLPAYIPPVLVLVSVEFREVLQLAPTPPVPSVFVPVFLSPPLHPEEELLAPEVFFLVVFFFYGFFFAGFFFVRAFLLVFFLFVLEDAVNEVFPANKAPTDNK